MTIKTTGVDHIHVYLRESKEMVDLFRRLFGAEASIPSLVNVMGAVNTTVRFPGGGGHAPFLDVFEATDLDGPVKDYLAASGQGVSILAFRVEDIDAAAAHAASCGLREISRLGFPGVMRQVQYDTADAYGFVLELTQYEPDAEEKIAEMQRRKAAGLPVEGLGTPPERA
ncbi:VOC family protein [Yinghuangia sp. YIM S09857]|uniref:VOC family protein n=1 Tax=Yinghuangia sp. YIM S09857 TaxID=3436929 RepID=UPI003F52980A